MRYFLDTRDGRRLEVSVEERGAGRFRVRCSGREFEADFADVDYLGQYALALDARSFAVSIEPAAGGELLVRIAGESFALKALDEREHAAGAVGRKAAAAGETVLAPIPGVVIGVRVRPGERVPPGAAVAVVEAMKMQNEIAAAHGGVVLQVLVQVGQTVAPNQPLVVLAPAADAQDAAGA
ncbi:MAG: hypothetical protein EYC70_11575 [Planctomycetota bacterium]|nr:MAG: hypothetical protein EYC70_11575 [Planctomycetota bacterium]